MTTFRLATRSDDALLRSMLRDNALPTWVEMSIAREPSFFAGSESLGREWAVIAESTAATETETEAVGMYTAAVLPVHVDGRPARLGYLGGLRVKPCHRHRIGLLRAGYASIEALAPATGSLPWWFTVIAAENRVARRLLEAGLRGLPAYRPLGEYVTFALSVRRGKRLGLWQRCEPPQIAALLAFHNARAARFELSPVLDELAVRRIGLERFWLHMRGGEIAGMAALWDQRAFKQIVAHRYRSPLGAVVPAYNLYARLFRRVALPYPGAALQQTFIAFLALTEPALGDGRALLRDLLACCDTPVASLGLHAAHGLVPAVASLKPIRYPARIYAVSFGEPPRLGTQPAQPEVAWL